MLKEKNFCNEEAIVEKSELFLERMIE